MEKHFFLLEWGTRNVKEPVPTDKWQSITHAKLHGLLQAVCNKQRGNRLHIVTDSTLVFASFNVKSGRGTSGADQGDPWAHVQPLEELWLPGTLLSNNREEAAHECAHTGAEILLGTVKEHKLVHDIREDPELGLQEMLDDKLGSGEGLGADLDLSEQSVVDASCLVTGHHSLRVWNPVGLSRCILRTLRRGCSPALCQHCLVAPKRPRFFT